MNCAYLAFTAKGLALAQQLAQTCPGSVSRCGLGGVTLAGWTAQQFAAADALVFVGAAGIAVRAIAPHCQSKATDPAVDRKSTRLNSSHDRQSRMPSSA